MTNKTYKRKGRNSKGFLSSVSMIILIMITALFAAVAIDISHFVSASTEFQNAADAAALMGAYDLEWSSTATEMNNAKADALYMAQHAEADLYSAGGITIPSSSVVTSFSSANGGTNNCITVTVHPAVAYIFAPWLLGQTGGSVGASATAERLPISGFSAPPWYLQTTAQSGPGGGGCDSSPSPNPPTTFPFASYVTFYDNSGSPKLYPPITPTFWVDMGLSSLSTAKANPPGIASVIACSGQCQNSANCPASSGNPIEIGVSTVGAVHGAYNSNVSNPDSQSAFWTNNTKVLLPIVNGAGLVTGVYVVQLTGPYVPNSFRNGQGVFGEFGVTFVAQSNSIAGITAADPTQGTTYQNVGGTIARLIR